MKRFGRSWISSCAGGGTDVTLRTLDIGLLQAGASMKGEFENRLRQVIEGGQSSPTPIILFVDEAHTLIGAGGAAGTGDAANLLKPALARGTLRTIAATTWGEYKKHIEKDLALTWRFQVIQVNEPDEANAVRMARSIATTLEAHHRVQILDEALEAAVRLSHRYIPARQLPDKAVSLLDTTCARVAISQSAVSAAVGRPTPHRRTGDRAGHHRPRDRRRGGYRRTPPVCPGPDGSGMRSPGGSGGTVGEGTKPGGPDPGAAGPVAGTNRRSGRHRDKAGAGRRWGH